MSSIEIVPRELWGAAPFTKWDSLLRPLRKVHLEVTGTRQCLSPSECLPLLREYQKECMGPRDEQPDINFNFLIGSDGTIYEGRGWDRSAYRFVYHDPLLDMRMYNIGFIGKFSEDDNLPRMMEIQAIKLIRHAISLRYMIKDVLVSPFTEHRYQNIIRELPAATRVRARPVLNPDW